MIYVNGIFRFVGLGQVASPGRQIEIGRKIGKFAD